MIGELLTVVALPVMMIALSGAAENIEVFLGGFSWQAFIVAVWESIACLSIIKSQARKPPSLFVGMNYLDLLLFFAIL